MTCCGNRENCQLELSTSFSQQKLLTIGMATYDDFDGMFFSIEALMMYHQEVMPYVEILVVDNNPNGKFSKDTKQYLAALNNGVKPTYIAFDEYRATTVKNLVFEQATTPYVLCMDSHVLLEAGSLAKLLMYYQCHENTKDLLQGPLLSDDLLSVWTHFDPVWRGQMFGTWATDPRGKDPDSDPFDIPMQGMGVFSCRKDAWLGFNKNFRGFGGEEGYIHQKFRKQGARTLCLPFLRWVHRFRRPDGIPYPLSMDDKIRNYFIGRLELGESVSDVTNHFTFAQKVPREKIAQLYQEAKQVYNLI